MVLINSKKEAMAIVIGAAGFLGSSLVERLTKHGYFVVAVVRHESPNNERLKCFGNNIKIIEVEMRQYENLAQILEEKGVDCNGAVCFYLTWNGRFDDISTQIDNIYVMMNALTAMAKAGCKRFIITGSQAEYGATSCMQIEELLPNPLTSYGTAKVAGCFLSRRKAIEVGIEWIWARIFSLYGKYEPEERLIPTLCKKLHYDEEIHLSSCIQNWNYLEVGDAAEALIILSEKGISGEIYNVANDSSKQLREYVEELKTIYQSKSVIIYGDNPHPFVSLQPFIGKICSHTGWRPRVKFKNYFAERLKMIN